MTGHYIQLHNGKRFFFDNPTMNLIELEDVVMPLSRLPRFTGHTTRVYVVAEHAIAVALECLVRAIRAGLSLAEARRAALCGQHHDDAEGITGDISAPLKAWLGVGQTIKPIEHAVEVSIVGPYVRTWERTQFHDRFVKPADMRMLRWESENLLPGGRRDEWPSLEGVEMPAIDPGELFSRMSFDGRTVAKQFIELHNVLITDEALPWWASDLVEAAL